MNYSETDTIKFKKLQRLLKKEQWEVVGIIESVWMFAAKYAQTGHIGRFDDSDIAAGIGFSGDMSTVLRIMVECGWLNESPDSRLEIAEWERYAPRWLIGTLARRGIKIGDQLPTDKPVRDAISVSVRFDVFARDGFTCQYCGKKAPDALLEVDHVLPVSKGGTNDFGNLRTSCDECNSGKSDKLVGGEQ